MKKITRLVTRKKLTAPIRGDETEAAIVIQPPKGFVFLIGANGAYLRGADGSYLIGAA